MTISPSNNPARTRFSLGVGVFLSTLILYLLTSYPNVAYIDSGELAIVNYTLGVAHPTGYPLYTLLGRLFALLPLSLIATQNLFGSLCTALAVTILYLSISHLQKDTRPIQFLAAALASLLFAIGGLVWSQGVTNEVYSLHLLFISLMLYFLLQPYSSRNLILYAYLLGLSFGNHMSTILTLPVFVAYVWINRDCWRENTNRVWQAVGMFALASTVYLYLPLRAALAPMMNWGNPSGWDNLLRHVSGWQYQVWMFDRSGAELWQQLGNFAAILFYQFPFTFWPLILFGIYVGFKRRRQAAVYLLLMLLFNIIYTLNFSIADIDNYLLPAVAALFLFATFAIYELVRKPDLLQKIVITLVAVSIPLGLIFNWEKQDQSGNYGAVDGAVNFLNSCEKDALIFCANWDYISPWLYLRFYEQRREDVLIIDTELVRRSWYFDWIRQVDSCLYEYIKPEVEAFLPYLRRFEAGRSYDQKTIEKTYQAILLKMQNYPARTIYLDTSVRLGLPPPGELKTSGKLLRLVREGETFTPPQGPFQEPRFGRSEDDLSERERWHIDLYHRLDEPESEPPRPQE